MNRNESGQENILAVVRQRFVNMETGMARADTQCSLEIAKGTLVRVRTFLAILAFRAPCFWQPTQSLSCLVPLPAAVGRVDNARIFSSDYFSGAKKRCYLTLAVGIPKTRSARSTLTSNLALLMLAQRGFLMPRVSTSRRAITLREAATTSSGKAIRDDSALTTLAASPFGADDTEVRVLFNGVSTLDDTSAEHRDAARLLKLLALQFS